MWLFRKPGPSGFSHYSTAEQVTDGIDASGLTAIVTGGSSGIGRETARVLALRGAHVVMGVRNMTAGKQVQEAIMNEIATAKIDAMELDLNSMASVRKFASDFNSSGQSLNLLIYSKYQAYGQSKLANILHANELTRRLKEEGAEITANSLHPGVISTNLFRHIFTPPSFAEGFVSKLSSCLMKNVEQGAATTCYLALHPAVKGVSGKYFLDSNLAETTEQGKDMDLAKRLWDFSINLIK
ncbi:Glucose/ribitol dehydrogenase [Cynara cardunculus var. scolymus]|uniref:Glucose/ribitol dehydrogenase n=1 Tax=Cynara cardunculus var. scolymus TaxID=59895 RepID=A0A103Y8Z4_CYNCS|nr:Glucose/ribitol dehydrogenase [Cynara cardunculus var. scolymus]